MKICRVCGKEIKSNQSYKVDGIGFIHIACIFKKSIKVIRGVGRKGKQY